MRQDDVTKLLGKLYRSKKCFAKPTGESVVEVKDWFSSLV